MFLRIKEKIYKIKVFFHKQTDARVFRRKRAPYYAEKHIVCYFIFGTLMLNLCIASDKHHNSDEDVCK